MNFRAALRRLNRLCPTPSPEDRTDEQISAVLAPLSYDEKILLRDALEEKLQAKGGDSDNPELVKLDDNDKEELRAKLKSVVAREKKRKRPKTSDSSTRAVEQSPSTRAGVRRRKNRERASPKGLTATHNAVPQTASTTPKDFVPAERSKATHNAKPAKVSMATDDAKPANVLSVPENTMSPKVRAVPNVPIPAHDAAAATRKAPYRLFFNRFPYPHPDAADPDWGNPDWTLRRR